MRCYGSVRWCCCDQDLCVLRIEERRKREISNQDWSLYNWNLLQCSSIVLGAVESPARRSCGSRRRQPLFGWDL